MGQRSVTGMRWDIALKLGRVSNLPTVWSNVLAAGTLAGASLGDWRTGVLILAMSLFYVGGMYLNDAFDAEIDAEQRPERPIPSGQISRNVVFGLGFGMLAAGAILVIFVAIRPGNSWLGPSLSAITLASMIVFYNWHHKANPLSPVIMGLCRVLVYTTTALCFTAVPPTTLWLGALLLLFYLIGLTYVAKQENFGRVENLWPLALLSAPLLYGATHIGADPIATVLLVALAGWIGVALWLIRRRGKGDIPRAVVSLIAGISLLDALLIATTGEAMTAAIAVGCFALTLFLQRYVSGT
ncbi:MAG: UbiA family prenyltransferase [Hyphomicrobiaceae bacterium]